MDHIASLFPTQPHARTNTTERGDLMQYFIDHVNPGRLRTNREPIDFPWMGKILKGISTKQLYAIKSSMDDGARRGVPAGAAFWTAVKFFKQPPVGALPTPYKN
jgi:hypothetical protein